jgi:hypothetical protein
MSVRVLRCEDSPPLDSEAPIEEPPDDIAELEADIDENATASNPELCLYRERVVVLLRRYLRMSIEAGRLPSLLGREFFRTRFTPYQAHTFEDVVIFVHDVEVCLGQLDESDRKLIAMIALREHSQAEVAQSLGYTRRSVVRQYAQALDRVSEIFLSKRIMEPLPGGELVQENSCQEGKRDGFFVSACDNGKNNL